MAKGTTVDSINVAMGADLSDLQKAPAEAARIGREIAQKLTGTVIDTKNIKAVDGELQHLQARAVHLRGELVNVMPDSAEAKRFEMELQHVERRMQLLSPVAQKLHRDLENISQVRMGGVAGGLSGLNSRLEMSDSVYQQNYGRVGGMMDAGGNALLGVSAASVMGAVALAKMGAAAEQTRIAFVSLLGSEQAADDLLRDMADFAKNTPFEFTQLTKATRQLIAFGFEVSEIKPMLTAVGDSVAALGGGAEELNRVIFALGQMRAKGKISAEEMMQLAELGIPAWEMLASKIGTDIPTAMKMAENGSIDATTGINALIEGMNAKFGGMMDKQANTTAGRWSNLVDKLTMIAVNAGEKLLPLANKLIDFVAGLAEWLGELNPSVLAWSFGIGLVGGSILKLLPMYLQWRAYQGILTTARQAETIAIQLNTQALLNNAKARGLASGGSLGGAAANVAGGAASSAGGLAGIAASLTAALPAIAVAVAAAAAAFAIYKDVEAYRETKQDLREAAETDKKTAQMRQQAEQKVGKSVEQYQADARKHEQEARAAGYKSYKDLTDQARSGVQKAITDLQRISPAAESIGKGLQRNAEVAERAAKQTAEANAKAAAAARQLAQELDESNWSLSQSRRAVSGTQFANQQRLAGIGMDQIWQDVTNAAITASNQYAQLDDKFRDLTKAYEKAKDEAAKIDDGGERDQAMDRADREYTTGRQLLFDERTKISDTSMSATAYVWAKARFDLEKSSEGLRRSAAKEVQGIEQQILDLQDQQAASSDRVEQVRLAGEINLQQRQAAWATTYAEMRMLWDAAVLSKRTGAERVAARKMADDAIDQAQRVHNEQMGNLRRYQAEQVRAAERLKAADDERANLQRMQMEIGQTDAFVSREMNIDLRRELLPLIENSYGADVAKQTGFGLDLETAEVKAARARAEANAKAADEMAKADSQYGKSGMDNRGAWQAVYERVQLQLSWDYRRIQQELNQEKFKVGIQMELEKDRSFEEEMRSYLAANLALDNADLRKGLELGINLRGNSANVADVTAKLNPNAGLPALLDSGAPVLPTLAGTPSVSSPVASAGALPTLLVRLENGNLVAELEGPVNQILDIRIENDGRAANMGVGG